MPSDNGWEIEVHESKVYDYKMRLVAFAPDRVHASGENGILFAFLMKILNSFIFFGTIGS